MDAGMIKRWMADNFWPPHDRPLQALWIPVFLAWLCYSVPLRRFSNHRFWLISRTNAFLPIIGWLLFVPIAIIHRDESIALVSGPTVKIVACTVPLVARVVAALCVPYGYLLLDDDMERLASWRAFLRQRIRNPIAAAAVWGLASVPLTILMLILPLFTTIRVCRKQTEPGATEATWDLPIMLGVLALVVTVVSIAVGFHISYLKRNKLHKDVDGADEEFEIGSIGQALSNGEYQVVSRRSADRQA
ncbi:hypothetical protein EC988_005593 [Linderina pennispora]|nr:hypothetical protein EC988_005593 [Linderina pennispora]